MSRPNVLFAAALLASLFVAGSALAFTNEPAPTNPDGTAKFADPDALADGMADSPSGGSGSASSGYFHMFSANGATAGFGAAHSSVGTVTPQGTLQRPYDPNDPSTQR